MNFKEKVKVGIVWFLLFLLIPTTYGALKSLSEWKHGKHPGFLIFSSGHVSPWGGGDWEGFEKGLKPYDQLLSYNNIPFETKAKFQETLNLTPLHEKISFFFQREKEIFAVELQVSQIKSEDFLFYFIAPFIVGMGLIFTVTVLFFIRPQLQTSFALFLAYFGAGLAQILVPNLFGSGEFSPLFWATLFIFSFTHPYNALYLHEENFFSKNKKYWVLFLGLLMGVTSIVFLSFLATGWGKTKVYYFLFTLYYGLFFLAQFLSIVSYATTTSAFEKKKMRFLFLSLVSLIPTILFYSFRSWLFLPPELIFFQIGAILVIPLGIIRFNILRFDLVLSKKIIYFYTGSLFILIFMLGFIFIPASLSKHHLGSLINPTLIFFMASLIILIFFGTYFRVLDRIFFFSTYKFQDTMQNLGQKILARLTQEEVISTLSHILQKELKIKQVSFSFFDFESKKDLNAPLYPIRFPLTFEGKTLGYVFLGEKENETPYSPEDKRNIESLLLVASVSLVNAKQHESLLDLQEKLKIENKILREKVNEKTKPLIIGETGGLAPLFEKIKMIKDSSSTVLLRGESGTGKELIAHYIHEESVFAQNPFIAINCSAIPENLLESELFGHEKGSFTGATERKIGVFEAAHNGTLFLDEIGDMPLALQSKILRAIQEKEIKRVGSSKTIPVTVRLIAATHKNLEEAMSKKQFREDLYYRLNVLPFFIPPLRDRKEDIESLVVFFFQKYVREMNKNITFPSAKMITLLKTYSWPGNVRELQNVIERCVALTQDGTELIIHNLESVLWNEKKDLSSIFELKNFHTQMDEFEKQAILFALKKANGNKSQAARDLGIHVTHLNKKIKKLEIDL